MIRDVVRYTPPQQWGVLCIDVWDDDGAHDQFYQTALDHLRDYQIDLVVNCSMSVEVSYQDRSIYNTLDRYLWNPENTNPQINSKILNNMIHAAGSGKSSRLLNERLFQETTVHVSDRETFLHNALVTADHVRDWIILGAAWNICVHRGPLGIETLVDMSTHKFYIFPEWSIQTEQRQPPTQQHLHDDWFVWAPIPNNGYRLITRANNSKWTETI